MQRSIGWMLLFGMAVTAVGLCGSVAQASVTGDTISIAFARDEPPGTAGCALASTDVAGAPGYATANWINETTNAGSDTKLTRDTLGVASTTNASLTWTSDNTWATEGRSEFTDAWTGADESLMTGYLDCSTFSEVQVTNLPADIAAGYSVVIYTLGGVPGRPAQYLANGNGPLFVLPGGPGNATTYYKHALTANYVQAIGDDPANGPDSYGNYIVFTGLTGDLDIQAFPNGGGTPRAAINAIQIVKNP
ncbi:MAG TPA: hypothetical protein VKU02_17255 [Gemmataceae bacterium]|nr:hypothetical protein [Gemmataceae bacterium]